LELGLFSADDYAVVIHKSEFIRKIARKSSVFQSKKQLKNDKIIGIPIKIKRQGKSALTYALLGSCAPCCQNIDL
jgi:malate/lactate dehydrogenase